ncbi:MAG TPA: hypothetical protein VFG73_08210 [Rhodanobacteraceae bacterium]|nr:hypothetical protein [Rhodanobacteraceae bacterium]
MKLRTKIKLLSLAIVGFGGLALAGTSAAACPTTPEAWTTSVAIGGGAVAIAPTGLDGSGCKLSSELGSSLASQASVIDTSPQSEPRYRFQFLVDADGLGSLSGLDSVSIFGINSSATYGGHKQLLVVGLVPASGGGERLVFSYACDNGTTGRCLAASSVNLTAGVNRIEGDLTVGAAGSFRYWINAPAGTAEPAPSGSITNINNAGWVGADIASLGLGSPAPNFAATHAGQAVYFDTFDSRRSTYIGH